MSDENKQYPAAPNTYEAVVSSLTGVSGVLLSFVGAYFVAVMLGSWPRLQSTYEIWPFVFWENYKLTLQVPCRVLVSIACVGAGALFMVSILNAISAQMLYYKEHSEKNEDQQFKYFVEKWESDRKLATNKAIAAFHFAIPTLVLSLVFLLDKGFLTAGVYVVFSWYILYFYSFWIERRQ